MLNPLPGFRKDRQRNEELNKSMKDLLMNISFNDQSPMHEPEPFEGQGQQDEKYVVRHLDNLPKDDSPCGKRKSLFKKNGKKIQFETREEPKWESLRINTYDNYLDQELNGESTTRINNWKCD